MEENAALAFYESLLEPHYLSNLYLSSYKVSTGVTTGQIINAPFGAYYVWINSYLDYPISLARRLGRGDLRIVSPSWLNCYPYPINGVIVIVDHATKLTYKQEQVLGIITQYSHYTTPI